MDERQESASLRHELELGMIEIARQSPKEPHKIVMGVSYSMAITVTGALFLTQLRTDLFKYYDIR